MITFTHDTTIYTWKGYVYAILLLMAHAVQVLIFQQYQHRCFVLGIKVNASLMAAVYKKVCCISPNALEQPSLTFLVHYAAYIHF